MPTATHPCSDDRYDGRWGVPTFKEYLEVIGNASRVVGVYPETKHASFHDALELGCWDGRTFTDAVLDELVG